MGWRGVQALRLAEYELFLLHTTWPLYPTPRGLYRSDRLRKQPFTNTHTMVAPGLHRSLSPSRQTCTPDAKKKQEGITGKHARRDKDKPSSASHRLRHAHRRVTTRVPSANAPRLPSGIYACCLKTTSKIARVVFIQAEPIKIIPPKQPLGKRICNVQSSQDFTDRLHSSVQKQQPPVCVEECSR